jgi:hypothetical protein
MFSYLVTPIVGCWKNWEKLADLAHVSFGEDTRKLAHILFRHKNNPFPSASPRVVTVSDCLTPIAPIRRRPVQPCLIAVHPVILMTLLVGMIEEKQLYHTNREYRIILSPYVLTGPRGTHFIFTLDRGVSGAQFWQARFVLVTEVFDKARYVYMDTRQDGFVSTHHFVTNEKGLYEERPRSFC